MLDLMRASRPDRRFHPWFRIVEIAVLALFALGSVAVSANNRLAPIEERGTLMVGVKYDSPPYGFFDTESGQVQGFDVAMAREIAEHILGDASAVEFKQAGTDTRIPMLKQGDVDIVLATMTITDEREEEINFSIPYYPSGMAIAVPTDSPITKPQDIAGKTNCITPGSVSHKLISQAMEQKYGITDLPSIEIPSYPECVQAVRIGRADYVGTDLGTLLGLREQIGDLRVLDQRLTEGAWGVGVAKGNDQLLKQVNEAIRQTLSDGTWKKLYKQWTGLEPPQDFVNQS